MRSAEDLSKEVEVLRQDSHNLSAVLARVRQACQSQMTLDRTIYNESYVKGAADAAVAISKAATLT